MSGLRLLYLNSHRLGAYGWEGGRLRLEATFEATPEDQEQLGAYLRALPTSTFRLIANVAEESHQIEVIPFLQGRDRRLLIERKISQAFFGAILATSLSLGYEKTRRKNERVLLAALTNSAHFQPWLDVIAAAGAPLAGLYSVSQLGGQLLARLTRPPERCLLVTMQDNSLRESFIVKGIPVFSRMAPLADSSIAGTAAAMATEAGKLHQYLVGQRQIGRNDAIPVFVLAHPTAVDAVRAACTDTAGLNFEVIDLCDAAARLGLRSPVEDNRCDPLFLQLLATAPPRQQYLAAAQRRDHQLHTFKRVLLGLGAASLAVAVAVATAQLFATLDHRQETLALDADEAQLARRYQEISATFPQLGVGNDVLRQVAGRYQAIERVRRQPADAFGVVSRALDDSPAIELDALEWRIAEAAPMEAANAQSRGGLLQAGEELTVIRGTVRLDRTAQPRLIVATFDEFLRRLRADPEARVSVPQQPFDTEPGRPLKGGGPEERESRPLAFTVHIARKLPQ